MEIPVLLAAATEFEHRLVLLIPLLMLPFFFTSVFFAAYPSRRMVFCALVPCVLSPLCLLGDSFVLPIFVCDLFFFIVVFGDFLTLPFRKDRFHAVRSMEKIASLSKKHRVELRIENRSSRPVHVKIRDDLDESLSPDPVQFEQRTIPPRSAESLEYHLFPKSRGLFRPHCVYLGTKSTLGLWNRILEIPCENDLNVYPDLQQIAQYDLLARTERLYQLGVRKIRKVGQDNEFERLREYQPDDHFKHINWRATARRNKLMVKNFQDQRNQRIVFMIDCGRMMCNSAKGLTLLDHSFNSMLMLANVALRQGDSVGLLCFSDRPLYYVPPKSGALQMNRLLHVCFDIFPEPVESRYDEAFQYLSGQCRKRSLVILITNVNDEVNSAMVQQHLTNLVGRHLPLGILLRDRGMFSLIERYEQLRESYQKGEKWEETPIEQNRLFWEAAASAQILNWRRNAIEELSLRGSLTIDTFPDQLTTPLINKYLEIKARQLL